MSAVLAAAPSVVLVPADRRQEHATPVDRELDVVRLEEATDGAEVGLEQARLEHVLAVQRERVARHDASARAERQPLHVRRLRCVAAHHVGLSARAEERRVAHRQSANLCRRREIPLEERGRDPQCAGVVVEAPADVVGRQQRRGVHLEPQEVAHGVGVLGAVQAAQRRRAGVPRRRRVERALERRGQRVVGGLVRPRHTRGRHGAGAQLAHHLLPDLGVGRRVLDVEAREVEVRRPGAAVVTADTVPLHEGLIGGCGLGGARRRGSRSARRLGPRCNRQGASGDDRDRVSHQCPPARIIAAGRWKLSSTVA